MLKGKLYCSTLLKPIIYVDFVLALSISLGVASGILNTTQSGKSLKLFILLVFVGSDVFMSGCVIYLMDSSSPDTLEIGSKEAMYVLVTQQ